MIKHALYLATVCLLLLSIPFEELSKHIGLALTIGVIGAWRYSWGAVNFVRAHVFVHFVHPRRRAVVEGLYRQQHVPAHAFFLATSYKIEPEISTTVYRSIFAAAGASRGGATVVASVVEGADERLIRSIFELTPNMQGKVRLIIDRIAGTGKRDALATSLRIIARQCPSDRDVVIFVDGDSCPPVDIVEKSAPFFCDHKVGALTTDERCEVSKPGLFRDWFNLRFTQRQMMMSSMGLSKRILTLTGRMSVFRATLACNSDFIRMVERDSMDHWRLGRVTFLTGDDKSTWFWLLKNGWRMLYLPDVSSLSMETQPHPGFVHSAVVLMVRWFGNMLRTNGRALALGPGQVGAFTWWSLLDQRISMWTTLLGPATVLVSAIFVHPLILAAYITWVMITRYVYCLVIMSFRPNFPISYPFLLYFGQLVGAAVKTFVLFRLDRQKWTRQSASKTKVRQPLSLHLKSLTSIYLHAVATGWLLLTAIALS
ncbi:glycosyltransferase [Agrobacterium rosae]|uniref:Glycosyltransferase n=1 Tax=Agrobacterium rosae TaxID=1972867 RepID=A0AAW9FGC5_9HYPH|nr:glycosyltransferase [Agrobacterium rosae]MBN7804369.1 glycosyltransferase [Agrobacterium rosae]MDX8302201.1 glycosyltransferase [Agrobacterium rosae]POO55496.1 glycosyltransferase [Agrobacterium rosae]